MHFSFLSDCIETAIEVIAEADHPSKVKMSALTSGFDDEIALYDGTFCGTRVMVKHFVAVKKRKQLHILMELDGSTYKWTFQAGVGVIEAPGNPVPGFANHFVMNVSFRTRGKAASAWVELHQQQCTCILSASLNQEEDRTIAI
ncbi:hypothetical protein QOZ80_1AG0022140 [Eleusine coracana subsp. coracana]|nr:hypothetical protein QOZ80_1AG0022140 [Eleusine coracana subsp. coracana]